MQHFKLLAKIILVSLTLSSCGHKPVPIPDFEYCSYEGPAGGPGAACACAHTLFTDIPVAHYGLNICFQKLVGSVFFQGSYLNTMQSNLDTLCTENGNCTYEQEQAVKQVQAMITRMKNITKKK